MCLSPKAPAAPPAPPTPPAPAPAPPPPLPAPVSVAAATGEAPRATQVSPARSQRAAKRKASAGPSSLRIPIGESSGASGTQSTGQPSGVNLNIGK